MHFILELVLLLENTLFFFLLFYRDGSLFRSHTLVLVSQISDYIVPGLFVRWRYFALLKSKGNNSIIKNIHI